MPKLSLASVSMTSEQTKLLAGDENSDHALLVPVESNAAESAAAETPIPLIRTASVPDVAQIEAQIQKLRETAVRRASSLSDLESTQTAISEREQAIRAKESAEMERDEAIAVKQQLLQQAKHENRIREELQEKIEALSEQIETLQTRIQELNAAIAKKDELITALTAEKLQLSETVSIAENNTTKALETSRAWQNAATEEINAHAVTLADRDSLLAGIEQLDLEVKRHAAVFHKELYELEQATRAQIENLTKELQHQAQQAEAFVKALSIQNQASQQLIDGFKRQLPLQTEQRDETAAARTVAAAVPVIEQYGDRITVDTEATPLNAEEAPPQTVGENAPPIEHGIAGRANDPVESGIAAAIPGPETEVPAAPVEADETSALPRKLRRLSQLSVQDRKNHQLVWQNVKNDFGKTATGDRQASPPVMQALAPCPVSLTQPLPKGEESRYSLRDLHGNERETLSTPDARLESNVRKLTASNRNHARNTAAEKPVMDNNNGRRMRAVIAAGLSTLSISILIAGLAMYAATDGDGATYMRSLTEQLHSFQSEAARLTAKADQLLRRVPGNHPQETTMNAVHTSLPGSAVNIKGVDKAQGQTLGLAMPQSNNQDFEMFTAGDKKNTQIVPDMQQVMSIVFERPANAATTADEIFAKPYLTKELAITAQDKQSADTMNPVQVVAAISPR
jgi:hypothetical protein